MQEQRGRSRKRKMSPAKKAMNILKRTVVAVLCFAMVAEYVPSSLAFAAEGGLVIESEGYTDEVTLNDLTEGTSEDDTVQDEETGTGTDNEADAESDPDEEGGSEEGAGEVTGDDEDEATPDPDGTPDSEDDADDENAGSDDEEDEESEEDAEFENEADDEYTDADDEENAEGEDEDEEAEDEEIVEEEEAAAGSGAAVVPSTSSVTSYKTVSATIYTDDTYKEKLSDGATIELSGKMPNGAEVKAYPVEVEIEDITILAAYDITIFDKDGEEYEPEEDDVIEVTIENDEIREALEEERELTVFHMEDEDDEPEEIAKLPLKTKKPKFSARHFSIYIVGEEGLENLQGEAHYVYILNFFLEDDNDPISTQTVSPGEKVEMPSVPDREDYEFVGWFSEPNGGGDKYDFYNEVMPDITDEQDHEIDLYAHYTDSYYVHYMTAAHEEGDDDTRVVFHSESYTSDQTLDTSTAEDLYLAEGYLSYVDESTGNLITALAVTGWRDANGKEWKTGDTIDWSSIDGDLELYPDVEAAYWVYYDMNGHDSIENPAPEYVLASETYIGTLPEPEVSGYSFDGWYTAAEGGTKVTSTTTLESLPKNTDGSITLYAHWDETYVAYTINIWRQKATDGKQGLTNKEIANGETYDEYIGYYDYAESHYVSASQSKLKTGETPATSTVDSWSTYTGYESTSTSSNNYRNHPEYYGFEYSNTTAQTRTVNELATVTMASDGSTIINIYYNRVTITWNFGTSRNSTSTGTLIGLYDTNVSLADGVEPGGTLSSWPANSNNYLWSATTSDTDTTFKARFDLDYGITVNWREDSSSTSHYLYFYLEVTNEDTQVDENGSKAQEASQYGVPYTRTVNNTLYVYNQRTGISSGDFNFTDKYSGYYLVGYIDVNRNGSTQTTYTSASAGGKHSFSNDGYIFNNAITENTITLISSDKVVGVDAAGDAFTTTADVTYPNSNVTVVKYGAPMSSYPFPETLDGATWGPAYYYHFVGWYEDPTFTSPFSITTMPNNNVVAYADWELNDITVTFVTGTSEVEAPDVQELKATEKAADPGELEREGYTHVGWVDQNGKVFNFDTVLYADTTLTAIWKADDETGYTMRYDLNADSSYGLLDGYDRETTAENTEHFTVDEELWTIEKAFPGLEGTDYEEAYDMFIGWNTAADGSGTLYYPDDDFTIDDSTVINDGVITLYAVWAHKNESALILYYNYPSGYEPADGETEVDLTGDNLTSINLTAESGLEYHHEITVTDTSGTVHTYRFDGWSTSDPGSDPTDDNVDIEADATVAVDTLETSTENANYLFAVWIEVHNITVTKEVVNDAVNYTVPEDQTFTFNWSFVDGEGETNTNEEDIVIKDGGSFIIPDVASGESVTIKESSATGFTTSYNGAHIDAVDDGEGTYTFTMEDDSTEITVYNTVETTKVTVTKEWDDINEETDHDPVTVIVSYGNESKSVELSSENNWNDEVKFVTDSGAGYSVEEVAVDGYETTISGPVTDDNGISFTVTNTEIENPSLSVEKTAEVDDDYVAKLGDEITYTITVTNDGNVTITDITVKDKLTGLEETIDSLAPGKSETYTTTYTVTESDIEAGSIVNTATAIGSSPDGEPEDTEGTGESEIETEKENPSLSVEKTAEVDNDYVAMLGDEITYTITVTNDGNVTITDITVKDDLTGLEEKIESLAPGESETYTTTYTVTEADIKAGSIVNTATATGSSPEGGPEDTEGTGKSEIETEKENPSLSVEKTAEVDDDYVAKLGDKITYTITVTNDGNVTITDITVKDDLTGLEETIDSLARGESKTYTTIYTVTEADIGAGSIVNTATAIGTSPDGEPEDTEGSGDVTIETEKENDNNRGFYDIDEEIVPDERDSSTWEKDEEVEEKHAIEFEMTTTLPSLTENDLKGLVEDGFTMVFHNDLDSELKLDSEESTDLHIYIGGNKIDSTYFSVDINQSKDEWSISTLSAQTAIDDGCAFHVTVNLSKLYEAELISADNFAGDTQITVFFYADLEGAVEGQKYESTVWYEVYDGEEAIYTSSRDTVTVHVKSTDFVPTKSVDKGEGITVYYGDSLTYTITYKNTSDEAATVMITDTLNNGLTFSSASDNGEYDSASRTVTWTLENVEAGYEGSVTLTATVNSVGRTNGNVSNTAYVTVGNGEAVEVSNAVTNPVYKSTSSGSSGSSGSGSSGSTTTISHVRNVNNGKTGHWILEGGYLTLPDGTHPSNEYLDVDGEIWAFYTYGYAVAKRHTQYYTDEAISAVGYIPRVTGTWETIGWWFEYDDGTYPHDEWALLEYNGLTYWYHFDVDGWMDDGWFTESGNTYYLDPVYDGWRGHMMTGWQMIGGSWYYFSEDPNTLGVMLKDTTTPDGYYVDANGHWVE